MKKIIYVAGPYRGKSENEVYQNIQHARRVALNIWKSGDYALCPHLNSAFMGGMNDADKFLQGGLELVRRSDAIFMLSGWQSSIGARGELAEAERLGLPVYYESPL